MSVTAELSTSLTNGFIDCNLDSLEKYNPKLIVNNYKEGVKVLTSIEAELGNCVEFCFSVAFITESGVQTLLNILDDLNEKGIKGRIITSQYQNFTEPKALRRLVELENIDLRIQTDTNFHAKGYIFKKGDETYSFIIGSSNLTQNALCMNKEWNIRLSSLESGSVMQNIMDEFNYTFSNSTIVTKDWIDQYEDIYRSYRKARFNADKQYDNETIKLHTISPNKMQKDALNNLERLRSKGEIKALLISATGTGKTYLSAFDVAKFQPKRMLFLVHREQILKDAQRSFKRVLNDDIIFGFLSGGKKDYEANYLFSTIQTMSKEDVLNRFKEDHFDYICVDETHRAGAESYQKILKHFKPNFLLGMTATPERNDGYDIYSPFDHNIAYEIRLQQALEENFICPFHYYGISELNVEGFDTDKVDFNLLTNDARVNHIIDKIEFYGYHGDRVHGLVFCSRKQEAKALSEIFNKNGYNTVALTGDDDQNARELAIKKLEQKDRKAGLDYIFTVDIFSEGVDIPKINQIVMIRPTESAIIFVQQLGRGLRKVINKDYLVVIDFIGNYQKNFLIPIALSGDRSFNKDAIRKHLVNGSRTIPGSSTVNFDRISKKRIFEAIDKANFNAIKLIKEEYKNLKFMLGSIPNIIDFEKFGSLDIMRIFEKKKLGSYHAFLKTYEEEYKIEFDEVQEEMLRFVSSKLASGKRLDELGILKKLCENEDALIAKPLRVSNTYDVLTNEFITSENVRETYEKCVFIEEEEKNYHISNELKEALKDENFKEQILEIIEFGIRRNNKYYSEKYKHTDFVLDNKYTYEDACKLLEWDKNIVALNIGGYKFDKKTNTFPVFINYHKGEEISDTIKYEDRFLSASKIIALSKQKRTSESSEIKRIYNSHENGMKIFLFVRKNKDDKISKEFYFLGEMHPIGEPLDMVMDNTDSSAVEITYELKTPIREDLYNYITE
ncbi:MAG: DEAD/DEAH box helicase [Clostridiales bacterium]|nr:DEAD/DEAH box helicase [Clostridiales bacterium]